MSANKPVMYLDSNVFGCFSQKHNCSGHKYYLFKNNINLNPKLPNTDGFLVSNTAFSEFEKMGLKRKDFIDLNKLDTITAKCECTKKDVGKKDNGYDEYDIEFINCLYEAIKTEINNSGKLNLDFFNKKYLERIKSLNHLPNKLRSELEQFYHHKDSETPIDDHVVEQWENVLILDILASLKPKESKKNYYDLLLDMAHTLKKRVNFPFPVTRVAYNMMKFGNLDKRLYQDKSSRELEKALKLITYRQNEDMVDAELVHVAVVENCLPPTEGNIPYLFTCDPIKTVLTRISYYKSCVKGWNDNFSKLYNKTFMDECKESWLIFLDKDNFGITHIINVQSIPCLFEWIGESKTLDDMYEFVGIDVSD